MTVLAAAELAVVAWMAVAHGAFVQKVLDRTSGGSPGVATPTIAAAALTLYAVTVLLAVPASAILSWRGETRAPRILGLFVILVASWSATRIVHFSPLEIRPALGDVLFFLQASSGATFLWFTGEFGARLGVPPLPRRAVVCGWIAVIGGLLIIPLSRAATGPAYDATVMIMGTVVAPTLVYAIVKGLGRLRTVVRTAPEDDRQRIAWILYGMLLSFVVGAVGWAGPDVVNGFLQGYNGGSAPLWMRRLSLVADAVLPLVLVSAVLLSVFYRGSVDAELMLERTTLSGMLGVIFLFLFAGIEQLISTQLDRVLAMPSSVGVFISGGISALIVAPFHGRLKRVAGELMPERED